MTAYEASTKFDQALIDFEAGKITKDQLENERQEFYKALGEEVNREHTAFNTLPLR